MTITFLPKTSLGKWAVGLILAFFLFFKLFQLLVASGQRGGDTFFDNLLLSIPILLAAICGVVGFFTGISGIIKRKERSFFVFLSVIIGFFVLIFMLGEIFYPH